MLKGIYKAASGMVPQLKKQEITANNIANATTPGYKKDSVFLEELDRATKAQRPQKSDWQTPMIDQVYTDYSQGTFDRTGNTLDVAIEGNGFFVLESPEGDGRVYTRNGNFSIDTDGYLINSEGYRVLGDGGPIEVSGGTVSVSETGELQVNESSAGRLQVVEFAEKSVMSKVGSSGFAVPEEVQPEPSNDYSIRQGFLERANINVIKEMVGMIMTMRNFETNSKSLQMQDQSLDALLTQVGRTRM
ncbi:MAG: flagellar basal-body rod protein FlgF [FCB group bacterium]|nr:flagellar basal-body rod protein FlgF [FCB group bacterium]